MRIKNLLFRLLLIVYALYATAFIFNTSTVVDGKRYFMLFDDGMISMRYARHLADGQGLVWNPGEERVEGYTNPLWTVYMALFHVLRIDPAVISAFIQFSGAIFLLINLIFVRQIAELLNDDLPYVGLLAAVFTAFYLPLNTWSLLGMEVSILALLISVVVWLLLRNLKQGTFSTLPYVLLGVGTLIRTDAALPFAIVIAFMALYDAPNRRRHLLAGLPILIGFIAAQTLFRLAYYGDIVPNTYHLKVEGYPLTLRIGYGLLAFLTQASMMNWLIFSLPFAILIFRRDRMVMLLLALYAGQAAYSIYVGGDAWDWWGGANRFISVSMPLFFVLMATTLGKLYQAVTAARKGNVRRGRMLLNLGSVLVIALMIVNMNAVDNGKALGEWTMTKPALHVLDSIEFLQRSMIVEQTTTPDASLAVVHAGLLPYFTNRPTIDMLGKSDKYIASLPMRQGLGWYAGHLKWDYSYSIGQLHPDVIVELWFLEEGAAPYLVDYDKVNISGWTFYFRKDSPRVLWDKVQTLSAS
ncbi:MAG: hypothetical protein KF716_01550 [Anaerolineae bacterium]|nr:hypothetical protein [Anaerolineae bacterium]